MKETKSIKVHILNEEYHLVTDELQEHIIDAAQLVDQVMHEIGDENAKTDKKLAIISALQLASKLIRARGTSDKIEKRIQMLVDSL